jgi:DNA-binding CsgD family transcriptional regulator
VVGWGESVTQVLPSPARKAELETILAAVTSAPGRVVLRGRAGVGKTHLARAVARALTGQGWTSEWVSATAAMRSVPFGALTRFIGPEVRDVTNRTEVLRGIISRFVAPGAELLVVDDAQHLDEGSAALVHELAVSGRVPMLLTVRTGESATDAIRRLWVDQFAALIEVEPFDRDGTHAFLAEGLGGPIDSLSAHRLWRWTGGNALFLHELVQSGRRLGRLTLTDGIWSWVGPSSVSASLLDLLGDRIRLLDAAQREALVLVALGDPLESATLHRLSSARTLDELCHAGLLVVERTGNGYAFRMPHPLYADAVLATATPVLVQRQRRSLADAMVVSGDVDPQQILRSVTLRLDAGEPPDADDLVRAATVAVDLFDGAMAERCTAVMPETRPERTVLLARASALQGRAAEAEALLAGTDDVSLLPVRARNLAFGLHRPDLASELLREALSRCIDEERLGLVDALVTTLTFAGRYRDAAEVYRRHASELEGSGRPDLRFGISVHAVALTQIGDPAAAIRAVRRVLDGPCVPEGALAARSALVNALHHAGLLDEAERAGEELRAWGIESGYPGALANGCMLGGPVAVQRGRCQDAARLLREGVSLGRSNDPHGMVRFGLAWLAAAEAMAGDGDTAMRLDAEARMLREARPAKRLVAETEDVAHALVLASVGRVGRARETLAALGQVCAEDGVLLHVAAAATLLARLGDPTTAARLFEEASGHADTPLLRVQREYVQALVMRDPGALLAVADGYSGLGVYHTAAEAADMAAARHASAERVRAAAAAAARRDELLRECDVGPLPWWPSYQRHDLSPREREVSLLAARGLSNRAIADELVLSVRTVENHLRSAYVKLGITRRGELVAALTAAR